MFTIVELMGKNTSQHKRNWDKLLVSGHCPYSGKTCQKTRKSDPSVRIGTCVVQANPAAEPLIICPSRFLEKKQVFMDCIHCLSLHEPGNELHVISELTTVAGNIDYVLVSSKAGKVKDFVGIELQALDTTGSIWPVLQSFLRKSASSGRGRSKHNQSFGINWKMSAKTILGQIHHKISLFEDVHKKLVLVIQNPFFDYLKKTYNFSSFQGPRVGDSMHLYIYQLTPEDAGGFFISLANHTSTDANGVARCLAKSETKSPTLEELIVELEKRISPANLLTI